MHPTLQTYILGIKLEKPDFDWSPDAMHNDLAKAIPPAAIYGLFRDARQEGNVIYITDELLIDKARRMLPALAKIGVDRIEGARKQ